MRSGPVFDACVKLMYKFAPKRQRRFIYSPDNLEGMPAHEMEPIIKLRDSGLLTYSGSRDN
eukprot:9967016-Alexandrium_andersonii.AAC.1